MDDSDDDWLFDSIRMYHNLFMYDLQHGITAMDWTDGTSLCIATSSDSRHELAELTLPDKLLKSSQEEAGLIKNRDFHMNTGCYCPERVACLKHVPNSRVVATSPLTDQCTIQFWHLDTEDSDLIQNVSTVKNLKDKGCPAHITPVPDTPDLMFGSHLDNLCVVDSSTGQIKHNSTGLQRHEKISSLGFTDGNSLVCCCQETGDLVTFDLRENFTKIKDEHTNTLNNTTARECYWTSTVKESSLVTMSSSGHIQKLDPKDLSKAVSHVVTGLATTSDLRYLTINVSQKCDNTIYVSGFDSDVYVFDLNPSAINNTKPIFTHQGHRRNATNSNNRLTTVTHILHPWQHDLVLSAATDGSLHAWQYNSGLT